MQFTLNKLVSELKQCSNKDASVEFDFGREPQRFCSWRGSYDLPAIIWGENRISMEPLKLSEFIKMCEETIGTEFTGYKGGEYIMSGSDRLWVCEQANYSGSLCICGISDKDYKIILHTEYCEY